MLSLRRLLVALISEEDNNNYTWHGKDVYESAFESETNGNFLSSYRIDSPLRDIGFDDCYKGLLVSEPTVVSPFDLLILDTALSTYNNSVELIILVFGI